MKRLAFLTYGFICYALGMAALVYLAGFIGNIGVPKSIDGPVTSPLWLALIVNSGLVALFGLQHSVMARPTFKNWLTRFVPRPIERSTYVVASALVCFALFYGWQPMGGVIWNVEETFGRTTLHTLYAAGWIGVVAVTFLINHFELFGLQQVWVQLRGKEFQAPKFVTPGPYRVVRHPLYVGWLTVMWATPTMTAAHLVLAVGMTAYILIAIYYEERNLMQFHPEYAEYRHRVPMLVPGWTRPGNRVTAPAPQKSTVA